MSSALAFNSFDLSIEQRLARRRGLDPIEHVLRNPIDLVHQSRAVIGLPPLPIPIVGTANASDKKMRRWEPPKPPPLPPIPTLTDAITGKGMTVEEIGAQIGRDIDERNRLFTTAKPSKYRNEKSGRYASKREAKRAADLHLLAAAGEVLELREQVPFLLIPKQCDDKGRVIERSCTYVADFVYKRRLTGSTVVEDVKSDPTKTPVYRLKRKLMLLVHGLRITEI